VRQKILGRILGIALLLYGSAAPAFTLILPEQYTPSNVITDPVTLEPQVQAIAGSIRTQVFSHLRPRRADKVTQASRVLAANSYVGSRSDVDYLAAAPSDSSVGGSGLGGGDGESVWISALTNSLENEFSRTAFYGATHNLIAGYDLTRSDRYVLGVSFGHEASNFVTSFNAGDQRTRGFNLNPYFAYLLSDSWSVDLILGYGQFDTRQSRTIGSVAPPATVAVTSDYASSRGFVSSNLTNVSSWGDWKLTGSVGGLASKRKQDAYMESDGTSVPALTTDTITQWNLLGEIAYGGGKSEGFVGALYENTRDPQKTQLPGSPQPADDPDSVLVTAGWRYFGKGLTASFVFNTRLAQEDIREYGFSMLMRFDL
jgi:hypothetical protein